jgi:steroid delta-isomerase-like uncharacterized protein
MSIAENKALVRRLYEEGWSRDNLDVAANAYAADFINHNPAMPGLPPGPEGIRLLVSGFRAAFPDLAYTIDDQIAEGDKVASRWTFRGTHQGEFMGIPATGKAVAVTGITIDRIAGGQIVEHWRETDILGLLQQLGAPPGPGSGEA